MSNVGFLFDWLRDWAGVIDGLGSLLLSIGLVYLYFRQTQIQKSQQRLIEEQTKPILEFGTMEVEGPLFSVRISNSGQGVAKDLQLVTKIGFEKTPELTPTEARTPLEKTVKEEINELGEAFSQNHQMGNVLRPTEEAVYFSASPKVGLVQNGETKVHHIGERAGILEEHGIEHVEFSVSIEYADIASNQYTEFMFDGESGIWDGMIFDDMYY